jgi:hypothetical protein
MREKIGQHRTLRGFDILIRVLKTFDISDKKAIENETNRFLEHLL